MPDCPYAQQLAMSGEQVTDLLETQHSLLALSVIQHPDGQCLVAASDNT
ncbi:hypothetical protein [Carnimonas bestiolae]